MHMGATGIILSAIAATAVLTGCERQSASTGAPPVFARTTKVEAGEFRPAHRLIAEVKPYRILELVPRVSGFLIERNFIEGSFVKAGTVLYRIEPDTYELALRQSAAALAKAQAGELNARLEFNRAEELYNEKVAAPKRFDSARANLQSAAAERAAVETELAQAKLNLGYTKITAPFDGWIGFTSFDVGSYLSSPASTLAKLADIDQVRVEFNLSDRYLSGALLADLTTGRAPRWPVALHLPDGSAYSVPGEIKFWSNQVDPGSATLKLQALFANPDRRLLPGMYCTVELSAPEPEPVLWLDERALQYEENGAFVYVIGPDRRAVFRRITTGPAEKGRIVVSGLKAGETVALAGNPRLRPGVEVTIVPLEEGTGK